MTSNFPLGSTISNTQLNADPYALYKQMRDLEPVSFVTVNNMYYVTRHDLCSRIMADAQTFTVGFVKSTVHDIFGDHMMTTDGETARRYKKPHRRQFMRQTIEDKFEGLIRNHTDDLITGFATSGSIELRKNFASRLPILTMLDLFGFPGSDEVKFRGWYNAFEAALANNIWDEDIRLEGKNAVAEFHSHLQNAIERARKTGDTNSLLGKLVHDPDTNPLNDSEIRHNASIVLFGGISTVEALILNALYGLSTNPKTFARVRSDLSLLPSAIEETVRWRGPVQSAHRYVAKATSIGGVDLPEGAVVSCVLASANHDENLFASPEIFDIDRNNNAHIAFAAGPHICLGLHLARTEARIALEQLITRLDGLQMDPDNAVAPTGSEFHQPAVFNAIWNV